MQLKRDQRLNFRSLDLRSDESPQPWTCERNPQLGDHGIRRSLRNPAVLHSELSAIATLQAEGVESLMLSLPFLTVESELRAAKREIHAICHSQLPLGVFIETPAAAQELPFLIDAGFEFACIGTKDLTQLIMGCDRGNAAVADLYDPMQRPVLRMIRQAIATCNERGIPVLSFTGLQNLGQFMSFLPEARGFSLCRAEYESLSASMN